MFQPSQQVHGAFPCIFVRKNSFICWLASLKGYHTEAGGQGQDCTMLHVKMLAVPPILVMPSITVPHGQD